MPPVLQVERRLRGKVHVWMIAVGQGSVDLSRAASLLDPYERERARRLSTDALRRRYVAAHLGVRRILAGYLSMPPDAISFARTAGDKPHVVGAELAFNVSHSGDWAVCAIAERGDIALRTTSSDRRVPRMPGRIGVDIEVIRPVNDADGIVRRFFARPEAEEYARAAGEAQRAAFFELWTHKEAFVKATGEGLTRPLDSFAVLGGSNGGPRRLVFESDESPRQWCLRSFVPAPGYAGAIALDQAVTSIEIFHWAESSAEATSESSPSDSVLDCR